MLPAGGTKGAMLALIVELLACALTGAAMGFEADTFFVDAGNRPRIGQAFLVVDPGALAGAEVYFERIETLITTMLADDGVRLPGYRRRDLAAAAADSGSRSERCGSARPAARWPRVAVAQRDSSREAGPSGFTTNDTGSRFRGNDVTPDVGGSRLTVAVTLDRTLSTIAPRQLLLAAD